MQVVNGKLMTKTSIPLSRGVYQLSSYKLQDAEGILPDPAAKMQPVSFTVGLAYQQINVTLDGRQETDNTLLLQACTKLHGTATVGSIFPGTSKYNTRPLPATYPPTGASITNSSWYTDVNNYVSLIPIRGEWRVYSVIYRGFTTKQTGTLASELGQLLQTTYLDLQSNTLTGGIPSTFSSLSILNTLILSKNSLSGNIDYLGPLTKITRLSLENNTFSGSMQTGLNGCKARKRLQDKLPVSQLSGYQQHESRDERRADNGSYTLKTPKGATSFPIWPLLLSIFSSLLPHFAYLS